MSGDGPLARRYGRLLFLFPPAHRRMYTEEMIGVLLASTPKGRRLPGLADTLDLIVGGLRARLRPRRSAPSDANWPDALAISSIALPVLVLTALAVNYAWNLAAGYGLAGLSDFYPPALALAVPLALALRYRRAAGLVALAAAAWFWLLLLRRLTVRIDGLEASYCLVLLVQVITLAGSPGPRRAAALLTWRSWLTLCASGVAMGLASMRYSSWGLSTWQAVGVVVAFLAAVGIGLVVTLPKPVASRVLLVLAIPACSGAIFAIQFALAIDRIGQPPFAEVAFVPVLLACLATASWWVMRRGDRAA